MSKIFNTAVLLAGLVASVSGHTAVESAEIGGKTYKGFYGKDINDPLPANSPAWKTNQGWGYQPVMGSSINEADIIAHKDATPSPNTAEAPAGSKVTFNWHHIGQCGAGEQGWDCSHHGWTATYLAACNGDCSKVDKTQLEFFKIDQVALTGYPAGTRYAEGPAREQTGKWGTDAIFYDNGNAHTVTIPSEIPSGNYVLRTEVASIHNSGAISKRQFWPQAFNIKVTGGDDSASVPAGVKGTEIYSTKDVLLNWDLYQHDAGKTIEDAPGPALASVAVASNTRRHARDFSN
ncbi:glycoside hydrolase [Lizonia empirigonia]|nr:glycoside hydrolase [Lizonia empirigonia]